MIRRLKIMKTSDQKVEMIEAGFDGISSEEMSLLHLCKACGGKCCIGRTIAIEKERGKILEHSGRDEFTHWRNDIYYLDPRPCPYLKDGLCSIQEVKPFICQVFPFVPRVKDGKLWLYCVGECPFVAKLPEEFPRKAERLTQYFFAGRSFSEYAQYWTDNKIGDFDDSLLVYRIGPL